MDVALLEQAGVDPEACRPALDQTERRLGALLHHVAQLPGEDQLAAARHARRLDEQDVAAARRPGQPGGDPRHAGPHGDLVLELLGTENAVQVLFINGDRLRAALGEAHGDPPEHAADLPLQVAAAGLPRVAADDRPERAVGDRCVLGGEAVGGELPADQVALGDLQLFILGVARQLDHFHAVAQRPRDVVEHVGRGNEEHLREIERHRQVVVAERRILLGIQHLQQRRRRIAVKARAELVHLVQHEQTVVRAGLADVLNDGAGQGADVGAPVTADLRLVVDAAQACAHELAAGGAGDALTQRGLADARRADEAQDRALALRVELAHREKLENPPLDLFQAIVVGVEHPPRFGDVDRAGAEPVPRQLDQGVKVGADHGVLAGRLGHPLQALQLLAGLLFHLLRHFGLGDGLRQLGDLRRLLIFFAELPLDGAQLFAQEEFPLLLVHLLFGLLPDLAGDFHHLDAVTEFDQHVIHPVLEVDGLENLLLLGRIEIHEVGDRVAHHRR